MPYNKIYYINLESSINRKNTLLQELNKQNLIAEQFPAIDGKHLSKDQIKIHFQTDNFFILPGNIGTLLSHVNLWKKIKEEDNEIVLILEDDVILVDNFREKLEYLYKEVPENWDMLYIGSNKLRGDKLSENVLKPVEGNIIAHNSGMFGYLIKKSSINKILNILLPLPDRYNCIDVVLRSNFSKFNAYFLIPKLIQHNNKFQSERLSRNN